MNDTLTRANQPKMSIQKAADFLGISVQAVHRQLKTKNLVCPKSGKRSYITNSIARQLFEIPFKSQIIAGQIVKGGTGKTTSIQNIACCASTYGATVLCVDIDPQGNLTDAYNVDPEEYPVMIDFIEGDIDVREGIIPVAEGIDLLASRIENATLDSLLSINKHPLNSLFRDLLGPVINNYDFILIDCPPTMGHAVTASSLFADVILAPLNPDKFSAKGLQLLKQETRNIKKIFKKDVDYKVFLNKFSGNTILSDKAIASIIADPALKGRALQTAVRFAQEIPNTTDSNKSLFNSLKKSIARDDFDQLTRELLDIHPVQKTRTTNQELALEA